MELKFNENQIKNVVYEFPNGKIVNFKLRNGDLYDVQIVYDKEAKIVCTKDDAEKDADVKTLEASRKKEWKEAVSVFKPLAYAETINGATDDEISKFRGEPAKEEEKEK